MGIQPVFSWPVRPCHTGVSPFFNGLLWGKRFDNPPVGDVPAGGTGVVNAGYRGNASITPPSTGSVAPVVGVALLAKNTTAFPT